MVDEIIIGIVRIIVVIFRAALCENHACGPHVSYDFYRVILEVHNDRTVRCKDARFSGAVIEFGYDIAASAHHILAINGFREKISVQIHQSVGAVQVFVFNNVGAGDKHICLHAACCGYTCFACENIDRLCGSVRYGNAAGSVDDRIFAPDFIVGTQKNTVARQNLLLGDRCEGVGDRVVDTAAGGHVVGNALQGRLHLGVIVIHLAEFVAEIIELGLLDFAKLCRSFLALICRCLCCRRLRHADDIVHNVVNGLFLGDLISDNMNLDIVYHQGRLILSYSVSDVSCGDELYVCQLFFALVKLGSAGLLVGHHNTCEGSGTGNLERRCCQNLTVINAGSGQLAGDHVAGHIV